MTKITQLIETYDQNRTTTILVDQEVHKPSLFYILFKLKCTLIVEIHAIKK